MLPPSISTEGLDGTIIERLKAVRLVALDVDGVLTDGQVIWCGGQQQQNFNVHDGAGLVWLRRAGIAVTWITGRGCPATERRAEELGVSELHMGVRDKTAVLHAVQQQVNADKESTLSMGDDIMDLGLARASSLFCAPADARPQILEIADWVSPSAGGCGAVRDLAELILGAKGLWDDEVAQHFLLPDCTQRT